jgi:MipA family protein
MFSRGQAKCPIGLCVLLCVLLFATNGAEAQVTHDKPLWEVGAGLGIVSFPTYRGSDQSQTLILPTPYFTYHGKFLKSDRHGVRGQLINSDLLDLTISGALSPPAPSQKIEARRGMTDLDATFELGPQLDVTLWHSTEQKQTLKLLLPLRTAHTLTRDLDHLGWVFHPKLNLDVTGMSYFPGWNLGLQAGMLFGDKRQHRYYYGVDPVYADATRTAYTAPGGYAGTQFLAAVSKRYEKHWIGAFIRKDSLSGARFIRSPLVRDQRYWAAGFAVSWIWGESSTRVVVDD